MSIPSAEEFFGDIEYIILSSNGGYDSDEIISMIKERDEAIRQGEYTRVAHEWISKHPEINE